MAIPFVKMHGLSNDYVYLDAVTRPDLGRLPLHGLAVLMSNRRTGVGADGLIVISVAEKIADAHARMRIFNADGSEAEMCGNGIRCVAKYLHDRLGVKANPLRIEVGLGRRRAAEVALRLDADGRVYTATVDMGPPSFRPEVVPFRPELARGGGGPGSNALEYEIELPEGAVRLIPVSMGNPHAVIFLDRKLGGTEMRGMMALQSHPAFPQSVNVHAVTVHTRRSAMIWSVERGAGITMACGTGACATLAAAVASGRMEHEAVMTLEGGDLNVRWDGASGHVFMNGPAEEVFEGTWPE